MSDEPTTLDSSTTSSTSSSGSEASSLRLDACVLVARELGLSFGATEIVAVSGEADDDGEFGHGGGGTHRLWADMIEEEEAEQQRIATEDRLEQGKKLFVGGLQFNGASSSSSVAATDCDDPEGHKRLAVSLFVVWKMLASVAGSELVRLKVCLDRQFVFGVFGSRNRAFAAIRALKTFEARKALIAAQEAFLLNELHLDPALVAQCLPKPSMYCRWPRSYVVSRIKAQAKNNSKRSSATTATATKTINKKKPKKQAPQ